jgi:hypothetical protein
MKGHLALLQAKDLLALDGDTLILVDRECKNGLSLDYRKDEMKDMYELTIFGDVWLSVVSQCA